MQRQRTHCARAVSIALPMASSARSNIHVVLMAPRPLSPIPYGMEFIIGRCPREWLAPGLALLRALRRLAAEPGTPRVELAQNLPTRSCTAARSTTRRPMLDPSPKINVLVVLIFAPCARA